MKTPVCNHESVVLYLRLSLLFRPNIRIALEIPDTASDFNHCPDPWKHSRPVTKAPIMIPQPQVVADNASQEDVKNVVSVMKDTHSAIPS